MERVNNLQSLTHLMAPFRMVKKLLAIFNGIYRTQNWLSLMKDSSRITCFMGMGLWLIMKENMWDSSRMD